MALNNGNPLTLGGIISTLPLVLSLIAGTNAYNNLQLQITEVKVGVSRDSQYLKETLEDIRSDIRELKQQQEAARDVLKRQQQQ